MANKSRALKIEGILSEEYNEADNATEAAQGMLTDLRHFCTECEIDFYAALKQSYHHYIIEIRGGDIT